MKKEKGKKRKQEKKSKCAEMKNGIQKEVITRRRKGIHPNPQPMLTDAISTKLHRERTKNITPKRDKETYMVTRINSPYLNIPHEGKLQKTHNKCTPGEHTTTNTNEKT